MTRGFPWNPLTRGALGPVSTRARDERGAAGLVLVVVLAGLAITGMLFLPMLVSKTTQRNNTAEEAALAGLEDSFRDYVRLYQIIPGTGTWATAIGLVGGLNATQVNCVFPDFPTDTTVQRVFVVDDSLGGASPLLPYTQSTNGLTGTLTNLLNSRARAMIVSSTKRGLALPVSSGFLAQTTFDAIWNWTYNPATEASPSGWSSAWTGNGEFLHVKPLYLPNLFSTITLQSAKYGMGASNLTTTTVSSQTDYYFLNGTRMAMAQTNGTLKQVYVVTRDNSFSFPSGSNSVTALLWYQFSETSGTTATNSGTVGVAANGTLTSGPTLNVVGPRSPTNPGFDAANTAVSFDGVDDYITTSYTLPTSLPTFSLAFWFNSPNVLNDEDALVGVRGLLYLQMRDDRIRMEARGTRIVDYNYNPPENMWTHIAVTANASSVKLYSNGALVYSGVDTLANYSTSTTNTFRMGGNIQSNLFPMIKLDDVLLYDRVLTTNEVSQIYSGTIP